MEKPVITVMGSFAVGMTLRTGRMPIFGETLRGGDFNMGPGGKGSNQAVGTQRLGARSYFAGIIGDDPLGDIGAQLYLQEGLEPAAVTVHTLRHTAAMLRKQAGDDLESISNFLAHSTLAITQIYLHRIEGRSDTSWAKVQALLGL